MHTTTHQQIKWLTYLTNQRDLKIYFILSKYKKFGRLHTITNINNIL